MRSEALLKESWEELRRYWDDEAMREFDRYYRVELQEALRLLETEFERFNAVENDRQAG